MEDKAVDKLKVLEGGRTVLFLGMEMNSELLELTT
jgi:hypothetical protein